MAQLSLRCWRDAEAEMVRAAWRGGPWTGSGRGQVLAMDRVMTLMVGGAPSCPHVSDPSPPGPPVQPP